MNLFLSWRLMWSQKPNPNSTIWKKWENKRKNTPTQQDMGVLLHPVGRKSYRASAKGCWRKERIWGWMPGPFQAPGLIRGLHFPAHEIMMRFKNRLSNVTVTSRKCQGGARSSIPMFPWPGAVQGPEHPWMSPSAMGMLCSPFPLFEGDGTPEQHQDLAPTCSHIHGAHP